MKFTFWAVFSLTFGHFLSPWALSVSLLGRSSGSVVKNLPAMQETLVQLLGWEDPLEKEMVIHFHILSGEFHGQRSLVGYSPWGHKRVGRNLATQQQ